MSESIKFSDGKSPGDPFWASRIVAGHNLRTANRYEAAQITSDRPYQPGFVRDARHDANEYTRYEICRKARYERRNNWLMQRLESVDVKYTVGPHGHVVIPTSSNPEWNKWMQEAYLQWCERPFLDSNLPMSQGHQLARKEMHVDGEVFENLTHLKLLGSRSVPAIELVESHRVGTSAEDFGAKHADTFDGVVYTRDAGGKLIGRAAGYHVRLGIEGDSWTVARAYNPDRPIDGGILHVCDPDRIGMARQISKYAATLNEIADLFLMSMLEIDRAKANAEHAAIFKTWNGELPGAFKQSTGLSASGLAGILPVPGQVSDKEIAAKIQQFRKVVSARIIGLKPDEALEFPTNNSPSAAQQWLWRFVIERVSMSRNIPMLLVLPESIQGTTGRAVLDDAQIEFTLQFNINRRAAVSKYRFFADWARYNHPKLTDAPADWQQCYVVPPPAINVDFGRNMNAMLAGIEAGVYDYDDIIGKDGSTAEARFRRKALNIAKAKQIAKEVSSLTGEQVSAEEIIGQLGTVRALLSKTEGEEKEDAKDGKGKARKPHENNPELIESE